MAGVMSEWKRNLGTWGGRRLTAGRAKALLGMSESSWAQKNCGANGVTLRDKIMMELLQEIPPQRQAAVEIKILKLTRDHFNLPGGPD